MSKPSPVRGSPSGPIADARVWTMKVREVIKRLVADGWRLIRTRGSHRQFKHEDRPGLVTIAGNPADDLAPGTLGSILKQAGMKKK